ncbi:DUF2513 domain-containing protein [Bifidobacterium gallicum]|uniref:DUF2513 domain-containing protein n=1 Tax=Bifidobacterium gallicum DSM 20093 = LMG 11596 TaxID=561180 RepID=D1NSM1_9BIFI|nr:DUF2513 domain-containing protein [Bifidobacterium gallicum]EFA23673.1 hypothetical protein BIFGAL_02780 [Bifidobacterium gallicum DSM 20093 = LMG 11596]KFI58732.1 hypothetical protein BGLCM_1025 [Bifidobacterium gallicum DSM 20093 = LMG 11596]
MRRDMDLVRRILLEVGDSDLPLDASVLVTDESPFEQVAYHIDLIGQAGLAQVDVSRMIGGRIVRASVGPLTWEGNDFLDAIRDDTVWSGAKTRIAKTVGSATLDTVKALAVRVATDMLMQ